MLTLLQTKAAWGQNVQSMVRFEQLAEILPEKMHGFPISTDRIEPLSLRFQFTVLGAPTSPENNPQIILLLFNEVGSVENVTK